MYLPGDIMSLASIGANGNLSAGGNLIIQGTSNTIPGYLNTDTQIGSGLAFNLVTHKLDV
jgi:hypothetical protein